MTMMTVLICMIPVAGLIGFFTGAMLRMASEADRQEEELFAKWQREHANKSVSEPAKDGES